MGLRETARNHLGIILNSTRGFSWPIKITDPSGTIGNLQGFSNDVSDLIDPETGQPVSGRQASIAVSVASLTAAGLGLPKGISDSASKPWVVEFTNTDLKSYKFKVMRSNPDNVLMVVTCALEIYKS